MKKSQRIEAIKHVLSTIFTSQEILRTLAPKYKWTGLGNVLGDYGECIGIDAYGLEKAPPGSNGFDALTKKGKTVQIKANHSVGQIGLRGNADLLLVLKIHEDGSYEEIYFNSFKEAVGLGYDSRRDNKISIPISKLKKLSQKLGNIKS